MKTILFIIGFLTCLNYMPAQTAVNCYQDYRSKGIEQMNRKNYGEAISQFVAGLVTCKELPADNDLAKLVQMAKEAWIKDLQASSDRERKAYLEAVNAKEIAEKAQLEEKSARELADKNAREAYRRGVKAESLRLALMADLVRSKGRVSEAVLLAWMALQMTGDSLPEFGVRAFADAVRDSFSVHLFTSSTESILEASYLPSQKRILVETADHAFYLLGLEPASFTQLPPGILRVVPAHQHDTLLVWEGGSNTLRLLNPDGSLVATLKGHTAAIRSAVFSPDDSQVWSAGRDNSIRGWELNGNPIANFQGNEAPVQELHVLPSGALLSRSSDGQVKRWSKPENAPPTLLSGSNFAKALSVSVSSEQFALLFSDGSASLLDASGKTLQDLGKGVKQLLFSNQGHLAVRMATEVNLYSPQGVLSATCPHPAKVLNMRFSGTQLITWASDNIIRVWTPGKGKPVLLVGHRATVLHAVCSADGENLLSSAADGTIKLWDKEGNIVSEWSGNGKTLAPALFSPDGKHLLVTSNGGKSLYQAELPMALYRAIQPASVIDSPAFSRVVDAFGIQFLEVLRRNR